MPVLYMYMNIWVFCMLVLYQAIPLMSHKDVILCLVASRYIQRELGMALSTIASDTNKFVDKTQRIAKHLCPQIVKYTQSN